MGAAAGLRNSAEGVEIGRLVVLDEGMAVDLHDRPAAGLFDDGLPVRIHALLALAGNRAHPFILKPQPLVDRRLALLLRRHLLLLLNQARAVRGMGIALSLRPLVLGGKLVVQHVFLAVRLLQLLLLLVDFDLIAVQLGRSVTALRLELRLVLPWPAAWPLGLRFQILSLALRLPWPCGLLRLGRDCSGHGAAPVLSWLPWSIGLTLWVWCCGCVLALGPAAGRSAAERPVVAVPCCELP